MTKQSKYENCCFYDNRPLPQMLIECTIEERKYKAIWKSVIMQALLDIKSRSRKRSATTHRIRAILWMNMNNKDFLRVCAYAEIDPEYVVERAKRAKRSNPLNN